MSVQSEVSRLNAAKSDLASAITAKGVTVPAEAKLDDYAALVEQIQAGGGGMEFKTTYVEVPQHGAPLIVTSIESEDTCIAFVPGFVNTTLDQITITLPGGWTIYDTTMYSVYDPQQGMVASTLGSSRTIQIPPDGTLVSFSFKYVR